MSDSVVKNGAELIVDGLEIGLRIWLAVFVTVGKQFILPRHNILRGYLADNSLCKVRHNLGFHDMLFGQPSVFFQAGLNIVCIKLKEGFKGHIHIGGVLLLKGTLPFDCFFSCFKSSLAFLLAFALPI